MEEGRDAPSYSCVKCHEHIERGEDIVVLNRGPYYGRQEDWTTAFIHGVCWDQFVANVESLIAPTDTPSCAHGIPLTIYCLRCDMRGHVNPLIDTEH